MIDFWDPDLDQLRRRMDSKFNFAVNTRALLEKSDEPGLEEETVPLTVAEKSRVYREAYYRSLKKETK